LRLGKQRTIEIGKTKQNRSRGNKEESESEKQRRIGSEKTKKNQD
jgi:hypothetical protein